ncbi:hypothetical protein ACJX0J_008819, partial [Zea mays]
QRLIPPNQPDELTPVRISHRGGGGAALRDLSSAATRLPTATATLHPSQARGTHPTVVWSTTLPPSGDSSKRSLVPSCGDNRLTITMNLFAINLHTKIIFDLHIMVFLFLIKKMDDVQEIEQRSQSQIFWTQEMSACALKYLAQLVADGIRVDKGFKSSHYNQCAKVVKERFQVQVSGSQVTNHLKTWRTRWSNICNYKKISSAHFDEQTGTILLDEKNYLERVQ